MLAINKMLYFASWSHYKNENTGNILFFVMIDAKNDRGVWVLLNNHSNSIEFSILYQSQYFNGCTRDQSFIIGSK